MKRPVHLAALACLLLQQRTTELLRSGCTPTQSPPEHAESAGNSREQPALSASLIAKEPV